jgi:hypothetical protein
MPVRDDILNERRFWAGLYAGAFGQIGEPPEPAAVCSLLGVDEQDVGRWRREFTGWYPGIFEESDGYSEDPAIVRVALANSAELRIEFHPGDEYWRLRGADAVEVTLANIGPHWALPGLRWQEATAFADATPLASWVPTLLLLPIIWLTAGDDVQAARRAAESAWSASGLLSSPAATTMAHLWAKAVEGGRNYRWHQRPDGDWVCDADWSTRGEKRPAQELALINRTIMAAIGPHNQSLHSTPR